MGLNNIRKDMHYILAEYLSVAGNYGIDIPGILMTY